MRKIIIVILLVFLTSCNNEIKKANWLVGNWENNSEGGVFVEKWEVKDSKTLFGNSYFVIENDTLFAEESNLVQREKDLFLVVKIITEPDDVPTEFKMTSSTENQLVFENTENDFPKKIVYNRITKDSIFAEISGGGKSQGFPLKRK